MLPYSGGLTAQWAITDTANRRFYSGNNFLQCYASLGGANSIFICVWYFEFEYLML